MTLSCTESSALSCASLPCIAAQCTVCSSKALDRLSSPILQQYAQHAQLRQLPQDAGGKAARPGMAAASPGDQPGPGTYGKSLTQSWLAVSQPLDVPVPAFGSSIARQAQTSSDSFPADFLTV